jgi:hypothetical protein
MRLPYTKAIGPRYGAVRLTPTLHPMKKTAIIALCFALSACSKNNVNSSKCGNQVCTENFATITISFFDSDGDPATVSNFSAVNKRTGDTLGRQKQYNMYPPNVFLVADDGDLDKLSAKGDSIDIKATDSLTDQVHTTAVVISGGECACHVEKLSGPYEARFN